MTESYTNEEYRLAELAFRAYYAHCVVDWHGLSDLGKEQWLRMVRAVRKDVEETTTDACNGR